jgi:hypothetical protein
MTTLHLLWRGTQLPSLSPQNRHIGTLKFVAFFFVIMNNFSAVNVLRFGDDDDDAICIMQHHRDGGKYFEREHRKKIT